MVHREEHDSVARVLVVLSDGQSNAGEVTLERAIDAAQEADVIIYTISTNYGSARPDDPTWDNVHAGDNNLRKLAEQSGGLCLGLKVLAKWPRPLPKLARNCAAATQFPTSLQISLRMAT